jgi:hypothetical protein
MRFKRVLILVILVFPSITFAQKSKAWNKPLYDAKQYHYGFAFSAGVLDFSVALADNFFKPEFDTVRAVEGLSRSVFGASMVGVLKLSDNFDLKIVPGLFFGQRDLEYLYLKENGTYGYHTMKIESTLLQFPLLLKYRAERQNNYRPYVIFGVNYAIDFAAGKKIKDFEKPKIRLNKHDVYAEIGVGLDNYLPFFKLSTELKFSYGLMNMINYDGTVYSKTFRRLGSKMVTLIVYFE